MIHRDVKPGNILVSNPKSEVRGPKEDREPKSEASPLVTSPSPLTVKLTEFGIGQVISGEYLADVTKAGFTQTMMSSGSSPTGTQLYLAPELMAGEPATTRSDLYSLGVVFYQLVVGAFNRPLTSDWAEDIADPLLREDIRHCVAGNPADRFAGAAQLAKHLRVYAPRKAALERERAAGAERERLRQQAERRRRLSIVVAGIALVLVALCGIGMLLYQGVIAFEIWTGKKAPGSVMKKALGRQMRNR